MPAVLVLFDVVVQRKWTLGRRTSLCLYAALGVLGADFTYAKVESMTGYTYSFTLANLTGNGIWYSAQLIPWVPEDNPATALGVLALIGCLAIALRDRLMIFGLLFGFITITPVLFLVDHLDSAYWYTPAVGIALCVGQLVGRVCGAAIRLPRRRWRTLASWFAPVVLGAAFLVGLEVTARQYRNWRNDFSREYSAKSRDYVEHILAEPAPAPGALVELDDIPKAFGTDAMTMFYRVIYNRDDITVHSASRARSAPEPGVSLQ